MKKKIGKTLGILAIVIVLVLGAAWASQFRAQPALSPENGASETYAAGSAKLMMTDTATESAMDMGAVNTSASRAYGEPVEMETRKLVRTADLTIRTKQFEQAAQQVQALLAEAGGYVEYSYQHGEEGYRRLNLSMRVPSSCLDDFLASMEGAGRVTDRSQSVTDMTTQYQDNEARLSTLYAKRDRLNELLLKAEDVADLIEIESAIADTQYEIDRYETSQRSIDHQVDLSAVSVNLIEERAADTAIADVSLGERIRAAFAASVEWLGEFGQDLLVFLAVIAPVAVPAAAIVILVVSIRKRKRKD